MRFVLGILVGLVGVCLSVYFGLAIMFVSGIVQIVDAAQLEPINAAEIAWGVLRVIFASTVASIGIFLSVALGGFIAAED